MIFPNKLELLITLILSFNQIEDLTFLESCPNLEKLDLSYNLITNVSDILHLHNLKILFLHFNTINTLQEIYCLEQIKEIRELKLRGNPLSESKKYVSTVITYIPQLAKLDDKVITQV